MITTRSLDQPFRTLVSDGTFRLEADTPKLGRGGAGGMRPHALLEAALASCLNISVQLEAHALGVAPLRVRTVVRLDRSVPGRAVYRYRVQLDGGSSAEERARLEAAARDCAVGRTLRRACSLEVDSSLEVES